MAIAECGQHLQDGGWRLQHADNVYRIGGWRYSVQVPVTGWGGGCCACFPVGAAILVPVPCVPCTCT